SSVSSWAVISWSVQAPSEVDPRRVGIGGIALGWCDLEGASNSTIPGVSPKKHPSIRYVLLAAMGVKTTPLAFPLTDRIIGSAHGGSRESDRNFRELSPSNSRTAALTATCVKATGPRVSR